jgi:hypothetical protein
MPHAPWFVPRAAQALAVAAVVLATAHAGDPQRHSRVSEVTIRDSHRTMQIIRIHREPTEHSWSRGRVYVNGKRVGRRTFGKTALGKLLAEALA